jgi:hypothetical protein
MDIFYASTTFLGLSFHQCSEAKRYCSPNFEAFSRKKWKAKQALQGGAWIAKAKLDANFSLNNFHDFMHLSVELSNV